MRKSTKSGSRSAKLSYKLPSSLRWLIHPEEQERNEPEYRIVHTPDRPSRSAQPSEIPSEAECVEIIRDMQKREEDLRLAREGAAREHDENPRQARHSPLLKESSKAEKMKRPSRPDRQPVSQLDGDKQFRELAYSEKWVNPRTAPRPGCGDFLSISDVKQARDRVGSLPEVLRTPSPYRPDSARSAPPQQYEVPLQQNITAHSPRHDSVPVPSTVRTQTRWFLHSKQKYDDEVLPFKTLLNRRSSAVSDQARIGPVSDGEEDDEAVSPTDYPEPSSEFGIRANARRCCMPGCNMVSLSGLCTQCRQDFAPRPSIFIDDDTITAKVGNRTLFKLAPPPLPRSKQETSAPKAKEPWPLQAKEHIAHEMKIIAPPASPRKISVTSPTRSPTSSTQLKFRQMETRGDVVSHSLEVPQSKMWNYQDQMQQLDHQRSQKSLVMGIGEVRASPVVVAQEHDIKSVRAISGLISEWPESEYYFDDANFSGEEDGRLSPRSRLVRDQRESQVPKSLEFRALHNAQRKTQRKSHASDLQTPTSPILSAMSKKYAHLPGLLREYSNEPLTPSIRLHSQV